MPIIGNDDLIRIDLPVEGEWVEVKKRLSRGDEIALQKALTVGAKLTAGGVVTTMDLDAPEVIEAAEFAGLDVAIKKWSFPQPVTPENIRALDPASVICIKERLNEMYEPPRSDDESKNSSANGRQPRRERALTPQT